MCQKARNSCRPAGVFASLAAILLVILTACGGGAAPGSSGSAPAATSSTSPIRSAAGSARPNPSAVAAFQPSAGGRNAADIKPVELLGAAQIGSDINDILAAQTNGPWWANFPEFDVPPFKGDAANASPGERFFIAQDYARPDKPAGEIDVVLSLYGTPQSAAGAFAAAPQGIDKGTTSIEGPAVADEQRYFTATDPAKDNPAPSATSVRFRIGPVVGRVGKLAPGGFESSAIMAQLATPVVAKTKDLLAGKASPPSFPADLQRLMNVNASGIGPELGSAAVPPEAWALADTASNPRSVQGRLISSGINVLGFRRLALAGDADQVVEMTLFPFKDGASAQAFGAGYLKEVAAQKQGKLDAGKTSNSAFAMHDGVYEFQFSAGRYLADVTCYAPFAKVSKACEVPVRLLAEAWFTALGGQPAAPGARVTPNPLDSLALPRT